LAYFIIEEAATLGFVAVGFSPPGSPPFLDRFCDWIAARKYGEMTWIERHLELRKNPKMLLEDCRTIITLAYPYSSNKPCTSDGFSVARYTEPDKIDYHYRLRKLAKRIVQGIQKRYPKTRSRVCVDSAPILERSFAYTSGIGFIGKNNMLIIPGYGSYLFLVEILTTAFIKFPLAEPVDNQCGSCTRCVDACPTGALEKPYSINASRCLSYLTIEYKGAINSESTKKMGNCFFGCDICQEVCPFNKKEPTGEVLIPSTYEILNMGEDDFKERFGKTAFARAGLTKIKNNIRSLNSCP